MKRASNSFSSCATAKSRPISTSQRNSTPKLLTSSTSARLVTGFHFVISNPVRVQAAGTRVLLKNHGFVPKLRQFGGAGLWGGSGADDRDAAAGTSGVFLHNGNIMLRYVISGEPLQPANLDGTAIKLLDHTGAFTEHFGGADPGATGAEDVGAEDGPGGGGRIVARDFADERGDINARGAGADAGSIKTKRQRCDSTAASRGVSAG